MRQVITLGSPFNGSPESSNVWRLYELMSGSKVDGAHTRDMLADIAARPAVPCTAIYSKGDGVVAWQTCRETEDAISESIEVHGSHCGLGVNPSVLTVVADRLARRPGEWTRFARSTLKHRWIYPGAAGNA